MPRRSNACHRCLERKVRCDEGKPRCKRCTKAGVACPGYRSNAANDFHFVDQTRHVAAKAGTRPLTEAEIDGIALTAPSREHRNKEIRWRNSNLGAAKPVLVVFADVQRAGLLGQFLDLYLPHRRDKSMTSQFDFLAILPTMHSTSPMLQTSIDAVCLAEVGSLYNDDAYLHQSRAAYIRAVSTLSTVIAKPRSTRVAKDQVLATIVLLSLCELFVAIAEDGGRSWVNHVTGAQAWIDSQGLDTVSTPLGRNILNHLRHTSTMVGLVSRRATLLANPRYLRFTQEAAKTDSYIALYDSLILLPGILERADYLEDGSIGDISVIKLCADVSSIRRQLNEWHRKFYSDPERPPYTIVDVRSLHEFSSGCASRQFCTAFGFRSIQICSQLQLYWIGCVILDFTLLELITRSKQYLLQSLSTFQDRTIEEIDRDLYVSATHYCRALPWSCEPEVAAMGRVGTFLLRIVQSYFQERGHTLEDDWCRHVRHLLEYGGPMPLQPGIPPPPYLNQVKDSPNDSPFESDSLATETKPSNSLSPPMKIAQNLDIRCEDLLPPTLMNGPGLVTKTIIPNPPSSIDTTNTLTDQTASLLPTHPTTQNKPKRQVMLCRLTARQIATANAQPIYSNTCTSSPSSVNIRPTPTAQGPQATVLPHLFAHLSLRRREKTSPAAQSSSAKEMKVHEKQVDSYTTSRTIPASKNIKCSTCAPGSGEGVPANWEGVGSGRGRM